MQKKYEWSEEYRHRCEVRQVLRWRVENRNKALIHINKVQDARGIKAAQQLQKDCGDQWATGNRGDKGEWF